MSEAESDSDDNPVTEDDVNDSDYEARPIKSRRIKRLSNGKWKLYYDNKVFKREWVEMFPWVEEVTSNPTLANCTACNKKMKAHRGVLETHQKTKKHLKNLCGSDVLDEDDEIPRKPDPASTSVPSNPYMQFHPPMMEHMYTEDQFNLFAESPVDAAHQAVTNLIDKLVEKYHDNRVENLQVQNEAILQLTMERSSMRREAEKRQLELKLMRVQSEHEAREAQMRFSQEQHELKINAMEAERDAKLKAVEQQLMFARQEYEKKVKLLDQQLQYIK